METHVKPRKWRATKTVAVILPLSGILVWSMAWGMDRFGPIAWVIELTALIVVTALVLDMKDMRP